MKIEHKDMNIFHLTYGSVISTTETDYLVIDVGEDEPGLLDLTTYDTYFCELLTGLIETNITTDQLSKLVEYFNGWQEEYKAFYPTHKIKLILGE